MAMRLTQFHRAAQGLTLTELAIALVLGAVLLLGLLVEVVVGTAIWARQARVEHAIGGDMHVALHGLGVVVRGAMNTAGRQFSVLTSGGATVTDGAAGPVLYLPYANASDDVIVFIENGALIAAKAANLSIRQVLVAKNVTGASFTAILVGSPPARNGAVRCEITILANNKSRVLATTLLPRDS